MTDVTAPEASPRPEIARLHLSDLKGALADGWRDYKRAPMFGLFFSAVYVLGGLALVFLGAGTVAWTLAVSLGFPLVAPFAAVGLYEVSHRLHNGGPLRWGDVLGVVIREKDRQIPWMGAIIVIYFLFWTFLAHMIFAMFMGLSVMTNITSSYEAFVTPNGLMMIGVELVVGGIFALVLYSLTVVSLPLLLDKELDFVTAMLLSFETVKTNFVVMVVWAFVIATLVFWAMVPLFMGLLIVLPVLGHATWHLYRRALISPEG